jgi:hypothetical protein
MSKTAEYIITSAHTAAANIDDPRDRLAFTVGFLQTEIRKLADKYEGVRNTKYNIIEVTLNDAPILLEYEYETGQEGNTYGPPEKCWETIAPSVYIDQILVNGEWISTEGVISDSVIERWTQQIIDSETDAAREDYEERMSARSY